MVLRQRWSICPDHNHRRVGDIQAMPKLAKKIAAWIGRRGSINHQLLNCNRQPRELTGGNDSST